MRKPVFLLSDPLMSDYGPARPVILLAREFRRDFDVTIVSSTISFQIKEELKSQRIDFLDLAVKSHSKENSLAYFELYLREATRESIGNLLHIPTNAIVLNFSNTITKTCKAWYAQGPVSTVLRNIRNEMPLKYKLPLHAFDYFFTKLDTKMIRKMRRSSESVVANSQYCRSCYQKMGIIVDKVIYEPLNCSMFQPSTNNPSADYVLTYFGKETDYRTIKEIADRGVKIKAFGGKLQDIPKAVSRHPNIEALGWIDNDKLVDLYSNSLFTVFPFTDEEFGYIPAESMACGTPVLTYNFQGPAEVVINNITGWLAENPEQLTRTAVHLWKNPEAVQKVRGSCRKRAMKFDSAVVANLWSKYLQED